MSLLTPVDSASSVENREELTTEQAVIEGQRVKLRAYQKEHRAKTIDVYKSEKHVIDDLSLSELKNYIIDNVGSQHDVRTGLHSIKVNSYEHAIIKLTIKLSKTKGSRNLYIALCNEIIANHI